jgi:O-antigen/teichoic acid export membrane protein
MVGFIYSAQLYFGIVQRVNYALSLANRNHWQVISSNLCQLLLVWFAVKLGASFYLVIAIVLLTPMVSIVFSYLWTFFIKNPGLRAPMGWKLDAAVISNLKSGLPFLIINIASIAAFSFDIPLLTATVGSAAAGVFAVNQRLFSVANQASEPFLQLLWPAFQEGLVRGDVKWVKRAFIRALLGVVGITMGIALVLFLTYGYLVDAFFSGKAFLDSFTTIGFIFWGIGGGAGGVVSAALSTKNMVPTQFKLVMIAASLCIITKSLLFFGIGGVGHVVWCNALVTICIIVLPGIILFNKKIGYEI